MPTLQRLRPLGLLLVVGVSLGLGLGQFFIAPPPTPPKLCQNSASVFASMLLGWSYFSAWSLSFYPQLVQNVQRRSVVGLSFDFALLNFIGFGCYSAFNLALYYSPSIRTAYAEANDGKLPAVKLNDIFFALHAALLSAALLVQIWYYPRGAQRFSRACKLFLLLFLLALPVGVVLAACPRACPRACTWLHLLYALSYVKLGITLTKYIPQVWLNYRSQSTRGWNIDNVVLDFSGGLLSVAQLALDAGCSADWSKVSGDPVKFGLGFASMVFDTIFMIQHWGLYRPVAALPPDATPTSINIQQQQQLQQQPSGLSSSHGVGFGGGTEQPLLLVSAPRSKAWGTRRAAARTEPADPDTYRR